MKAEATEAATADAVELYQYAARNYLWRTGQLHYLLHPTQRRIHDTVNSSQSPEVLVFASRQLGKSYWAACYALEHCIRYPGSIVRILAPTLKQVQDIVNDNLVPITREAPDGLIHRHKSDYRWTIGTSSLRLGSLERANVEANRGGNASLIICEEGGSVLSEDYDYAIRSVIGPQLLRSSGRLVHVTTPSTEPSHYIHTTVLPACGMTGALFRFTIYDNPQLTPAQIQKAIDLAGGTSSTAWKREYLAEIVRDEVLSIVPTFSRAHHVKKIERPPHVNQITSIDWGGVRDNTHALTLGLDFRRDVIQVFGESVAPPSTPTDRIVTAIHALELGHTQQRFADVPGQLQIDLAANHSLPVIIPTKSDWMATVNQTQLLFSQGKIEIDESCTVLIQTLESGQFNKQRTDFMRYSGVLGHCDGFAALMYGCRMLPRTDPYPFIAPNPDTTWARSYSPPPPAEQKINEILPQMVNSPSFDESSPIPRKAGVFRPWR